MSQQSNHWFIMYFFIVKSKYYTMHIIYPALILVDEDITIYLGHKDRMNIIFEEAYSGLDVSVDGYCTSYCVVCNYVFHILVRFVFLCIVYNKHVHNTRIIYINTFSIQALIFKTTATKHMVSSPFLSRNSIAVECNSDQQSFKHTNSGHRNSAFVNQVYNIFILYTITTNSFNTRCLYYR